MIWYISEYSLGFNRKEFRGKLAIAVTANFINRHTIEEARVPEISGVAFIFNQKFFQVNPIRFKFLSLSAIFQTFAFFLLYNLSCYL